MRSMGEGHGYLDTIPVRNQGSLVYHGQGSRSLTGSHTLSQLTQNKREKSLILITPYGKTQNSHQSLKQHASESAENKRLNNRKPCSPQQSRGQTSKREISDITHRFVSLIVPSTKYYIFLVRHTPRIPSKLSPKTRLTRWPRSSCLTSLAKTLMFPRNVRVSANFCFVTRHLLRVFEEPNDKRSQVAKLLRPAQHPFRLFGHHRLVSANGKPVERATHTHTHPGARMNATGQVLFSTHTTRAYAHQH